MNHPYWIKLGWVGGTVVALLALHFHLNVIPSWWQAWRAPNPQSIYRVIEIESSKHGLDPAFVYAIVFAESSLNPSADTGYARGLMQVSRAAWVTVEDRPWREAYNWRLNLRVGIAYLAYLKGRLEQSGHFSYPLLAASYRYGINRVRSADYDLSKLPATRNLIYQQIFAGQIHPIATP